MFMSLSRNSRLQEENVRREALMEQIATLTGELRAMSEERGTRAEIESLLRKKHDLMEQVEQLRIEKARITEQHAKELREVEHSVGLQQRRAEFEKQAATREAELKVREENLQHEQEAFEKQLKFITERFGETEAWIKEAFSEVLGRVPKVTVNRRETITEKLGPEPEVKPEPAS